MRKQLVLVLLLGLFIRIVVIFWGYHGDLNNNLSWGQLLIERGTNGFYEGENWPYSAPNQPPLYLLLFGFVVAIGQLITKASFLLNDSLPFFPSQFIWFWEVYGNQVILKILPIVADLGIAVVLYKLLKEKNQKLAIWASLLWIVNPISWYISSIWGQTDPIVNFLGLIAIYFLLQRRLVYFTSLLALAFLFKPSLSVFLPVLALIVIKQKYSLNSITRSLAVALAIVIAASICFHPKLDLFQWLFYLYTERFLPGEIGYLTANAFNFWWLVNPGIVLDSTNYFGLPAKTWGYVLSFLFGLLVLVKVRLNKRRIIYSLALSSLIAFLFLTRIHERYLFPFFPFATLLVVLNKRLIPVYIVLSLSYLINLYHLFWVPTVPLLENMLKTTNYLQNILSVLNIMILIFLLYFYYKKNEN